MDPTTAPAPAAHAKQMQYVFVDEYNRHKRLKVMRACDGCRKRKIRCDGALQNGPWPCGACVRLKLKCVPPTLDQDEDPQAVNAPQDGQFTFQNTFSTVPPGQNTRTTRPQVETQPMNHTWSISSSQHGSDGAMLPQHQQSDVGNYHQQAYTQAGAPSNMDSYLGSAVSPATFEQSQRPHTFARSDTQVSSSSSGDAQEVDATVQSLSEVMGDLKIGHTAVAPYIANHRKNSVPTPVVAEAEIALPPSVYTDSTIRIPPEMMPSEEKALEYFHYFFEFVHPYMPVLSRADFFHQWQFNRSNIPPLLLEAVFACTSRYVDDSYTTRRWLALAAKHEESFKDVPRISTIQAMILLIKAREFAPVQGYFYRSWMAVKYMVTMAFDLGLNEHHDEHTGDQGHCALTQADCMARIKVWQNLFALEILVGAPQGRNDFAIELETVDFRIPSPSPSFDQFDYKAGRKYAYFIQAVRNIGKTNNLWHKMRRKQHDWALDPRFVQHNDDLQVWLRELPPDLQLHFPEDESAPYLGGDHFVAFLHEYHHLVVIMHHRPQLQALLERKDPAFKHHLQMCTEFASLMCRVQEALVRDFGLHGLLFMQRGINFTIYCVLTCTMLHLAAITSPDPSMNGRARMYFSRHMRILEHCLVLASPEMQVQIEALREAFSVDTSKPFQLKPTLGLRSPALEKNATPPSAGMQPNPSISAPLQTQPQWAHLQQGATSSRTLSPASEYTQAYENMPSQAPLQHDNSTFSVPPNTTYPTQNIQQISSSQPYPMQPALSPEQQQQQTPVWDPSSIFNSWNTAFGGTSQLPQTQTGLQDGQMPPNPAPVIPQTQSPPSAARMPGTQHQSIPASGSSRAVMPNANPMPLVTPVMWQDAFTNAYVSGHGQKRFREEDLGVGFPGDSYGSKRRG
ncbi:hypothetical protein MBLNU230_g4709t1 [Neophaeotheca triangularis]